jgi:hypothetical protein
MFVIRNLQVGGSNPSSGFLISSLFIECHDLVMFNQSSSSPAVNYPEPKYLINNITIT